MSESRRPVQRALISVYDKTGLAELARMWRQREDWARAVIALRLAADMLPEGDERRDVWYRAAARWEADLAAESASP